MKLAIYPSMENGYVVAPMLPEDHDADKRDVARAQKKRMSDAAPELLAALELLLRATQDGNHITGVVIAQAQAAVRKARGL